MSALEKIKKKIRKGRGQGTGADYKPWITVQDFPSHGQCNREFGHSTGRQHDLMSQGERYCFLVFDWSRRVMDIREQFPLLSPNKLFPLELTISIAKQCGIKHPPRNAAEPDALTTDFLITVARPIGTVLFARTFKRSSELSNKRVIEKFEIERRYWVAQAVDWGIITEHQIDMVLAKNIEWVHPYRDITSLHPLTEDKVEKIATTLTRMIANDSRTLSDIALYCDDRMGIEHGRSLAVARFLIGSRQWEVDMTKPIHPECRFDLLDVCLQTRRKKASGE